MAISASELNVILSARDKEFNRAMARAQKQVNRFAAKSDKNLKQVERGFGGLGRAAKALAPILAGVFSVRAVNNIVQSTAQLADLARIAGVNTTEFQKLSAAARTVGVQQDKLSDIIKDVNDKVGDFLITGAGPLADFFEVIAPKVGITADNFKNLSGPDALQLYVSSLQKANVSQAEMTFFLEAIASDATALIPLLVDNGDEMRRLGDEAERTGRIMSEDAVRGAEKMREEFQSLTGTMETMIKEAILENADDIIAMVKTFTDDILPKLVKLGSEVSKYFGGGPGAQVSDEQALIDKALDDEAFREGSKPGGFNAGDPSTTGLLRITINGRDLDLTGNYEVDKIAADALAALSNLAPQTSQRPRARPVSSKKSSSGRSGRGVDPIKQAREAFDFLRASLDPVLAAQMQYNEQLLIMDEYERLTGQKIANKTEIIDQLKDALARNKMQASDLATVYSTLENGLENAFMAGLEGAKSFEDAMRQTAAQVVRELYRVLVAQQAINALLGGPLSFFTGSSFFGFSNRASGGMVNKGQPYVVGEQGREIFVPSQSGRVLSVPQSKDAVQGGEGGGVTVQQTINVTTGVQQTVRNEIQSLMPVIAESAKGAVADARQRGGSYKRALG